MKGTAVGQCAVRLSAEGVPEELVVKMTATVEANLLRKAYHFLDVTSRFSFSLLLEQVVKVAHVGAMMLAVMEVKEMTRDDGLEASNLIRKMLELDARSLHGSTKVPTDNVANHIFFRI